MSDLMRAVREAVPCLATLAPVGLIDTMTELHRVESVLVERKLALIAALADHRLCDAARDEIDCGAEVAEAEVGAALTVGRGEAGRLIELGTALGHRLPRVREAMAAGRLDAYRAGLIARATRNVSEEHIADVERLALAKILATGADGVGLTGQRARNAIAAIIGRIDPAGVRERRRRAATDRHVGVSAAEDAMVHLFGVLPAADGRKLDSRLRELANTVCPADGRTFDQRKADALGALVDGLEFLPCACGRDSCPQETGNVPTARKPLVHVILLGSTLHGEDEESGYLDGYGLIDADHARTLAADATLEYVRVPDDVQYHRTHNTTSDTAAPDATAPHTTAPHTTAPHTAATDARDEGNPETTTAASADTGTAAQATTTDSSDPGLPDSAYVYRPTAILDTWLRILCGTCQWPHCDAPAWNVDLDHDEPFNHRDPTNGGMTTAAGMKPYCRTHHRIKHSGTWVERHNADNSIDYISPTGHRYHSRSTGYLDLLNINPDDIEDPHPSGRPRRRRRTRAENKTASIHAERRRQQIHIDLKKTRHARTITHAGTGTRDDKPGDDEPCPF